ncbi:DUF4215 domain-containing protein, partial [Patescibacteria group bacterium]|nr:DUF4215 domain-containing protein [Patescibacteria group bacterium]
MHSLWLKSFLGISVAAITATFVVSLSVSHQTGTLKGQTPGGCGPVSEGDFPDAGMTCGGTCATGESCINGGDGYEPWCQCLPDDTSNSCTCLILTEYHDLSSLASNPGFDGGGGHCSIGVGIFGWGCSLQCVAVGGRCGPDPGFGRCDWNSDETGCYLSPLSCVEYMQDMYPCEGSPDPVACAQTECGDANVTGDDDDECDPPDCNDGNACTTDSCSGGSCVNTPMNCNDGNSCTTDSCSNGSCVNTQKNCNDGNSCTTDSCSNGSCVNTQKNCNDGDSCTTDSCSGGSCVNTQKNCDDDNECTTDSCSGGSCVNTSMDCDDGDACTADSCSGGSCVNTSMDCDDEDSCTTDSCSGGSCVNTSKDCDDGDSCTADSCSGGSCVNTSMDCDDGDACTADSCSGGSCVNTLMDCDDGDSCTTDSCSGGSCVNTTMDCDDGASCTEDSCVNGSCVNESIPNCCTSVNDCGDPTECRSNADDSSCSISVPYCDGGTCKSELESCVCAFIVDDDDDDPPPPPPPPPDDDDDDPPPPPDDDDDDPPPPPDDDDDDPPPPPPPDDDDDPSPPPPPPPDDDDDSLPCDSQGLGYDPCPYLCGNGLIDLYEDCERNSDCQSNEYCSEECECLSEADDDDTPRCRNSVLDPGEECELGIPCSGRRICTTDCLCESIAGTQRVLIEREEEVSLDLDPVEPIESQFVEEKEKEEKEMCVMSIIFEDDHDPIHPGESIQYSFTLKNEGVDPITNQRITFGIDPRTTFVNASHNGLSVGEVVKWSNVSLQVKGAPKVYMVSVKLDDTVEDSSPVKAILRICNRQEVEETAISNKAICGDGNLARNEECDDGNVISGDGCSDICEFEGTAVAASALCGDGKIDEFEECDDGNNKDFDGCNANCYLEFGFCGDGIIQRALGETCDDK